MALTGKLEAVMEVKFAADEFYSILGSQNHQNPNVSSDKIHTVEVHDGDRESHGSVKFWTYPVVETLKEKIEADDKNKTATLIAVEGNCLEQYKSYKISFVVAPTRGSSSVKIALDFVKHNETIPTPNSYLEFLVNVVKDI